MSKSVLATLVGVAICVLLATVAVHAAVVKNVGVGQSWPTIAQDSPDPFAGVAAIQVESSELVFLGSSGWVITPQQNVDAAGLVAQSTVREVDFFERAQCSRFESIVSEYTGQTYLCYGHYELPSFEQLAAAPFLLTSEQEATVLTRTENVVFITSLADRAPGAGSFFHDGNQIFYLLWIAGDCTPRIVDGLGGYWQVPVAPLYGSHVPRGVGYLMELPLDWQLTWAVDLEHAAEWRTCGASTFMN